MDVVRTRLLCGALSDAMGFEGMPRELSDAWPIDSEGALGILSLSELDGDALVTARFPIGYVPPHGRGRLFRKLLVLSHEAQGVAAATLDRRTSRVWAIGSRLCSEFDDPNTLAVLVKGVAFYATKWRRVLGGDIGDRPA